MTSAVNSGTSSERREFDVLGWSCRYMPLPLMVTRVPAIVMRIGSLSAARLSSMSQRQRLADTVAGAEQYLDHVADLSVRPWSAQTYPTAISRPRAARYPEELSWKAPDAPGLRPR